MEPASVLRRSKGGVEVDIMVTPNAKVSEVQSIDHWRKRLVVKVQAVPSEGRANEALCDLLSHVFGAKAKIVRGFTDRHKTIFVPIEYDSAMSILEGSLAGRRRDP